MLGHISLNFVSFLFIFLLSIQSTLTLVCYECEECTDITCTCNNTITTETKDSYCILLRENLSNGVNVEIKHIPRNSTNYYVSDPYYISVEETILYDKTTERWLSQSKKITYACQTDKCNQPNLLRQLPSNGLSLTLPSEWLNENLLRKADKSTTLCNEYSAERICGNRQYFINKTQCEVINCQDLCIMGETFSEAQSIQFCYESFCLSNERQPEIAINAIYYINNKRFEIIETDIICNGDDCSRLEIFKDIKEKLQIDYNGIQPFLPANHAKSIYPTSIIILMMILLQNLIFY
jgi:hypothetical protein